MQCILGDRPILTKRILEQIMHMEIPTPYRPDRPECIAFTKISKTSIEFINFVFLRTGFLCI